MFSLTYPIVSKTKLPLKIAFYGLLPSKKPRETVFAKGNVFCTLIVANYRLMQCFIHNSQYLSNGGVYETNLSQSLCSLLLLSLCLATKLSVRDTMYTEKIRRATR